MAMKTEEHRENLVDLDTVESVLSCMGRFAYGPGCVPSHGFTCCAQFGHRCSGGTDSESEE